MLSGNSVSEAFTGRAADDAPIEAADTVSSIRDVKHAFRSGVRAQEGIDR